MKVLTLFAVLLVTGCATVQTAHNANPQCDTVGVFASGIANLRETGITQEQVANYISQPKVQTFPITLIRKQVYAEKWTQKEAYTQYYGKCVAVGYKQLLTFMEDEDELVRLQNENATLISRVATAERRVAEQARYVPPRSPPPPPPVIKAYGAPINDPIVH